MPLTRRLLLILPVTLPLWPPAARASGGFARVAAVAGAGGTAHLPDGTSTALSAGLLLPDGSRVETLTGGRVELALEDGTRIHSGGDTRISLHSAGAQSAAALTMTGVMVIDRREVPDTRPMTVSGTAFDVELAGAQVFIESLRDEARGAVFVKDGGAAVRSDLGEVLLASGEGLDIAPLPALATEDTKGLQEVLPDGAAPAILPEPAAPPPPPPAVARWSEERVSDAFASVGLTT